MNKLQQSVLLILCVLCFSGSVKAQIIFTENWASSSFVTNGWTFPAGQANWTMGAIYTPAGATTPNAYFNWSPTLLSYSHELVSPVINATAFSGGTVFLSYKLHLNNYSTATNELFAVEYKTVGSTAWFTLTTYSSLTVPPGSPQNWSPTNVALPGMAGQQFQIRFRAYGPNSFNINGWGLDDIQVLALNPCTGTPVAGAATAVPNNPCPGIPVILDLSGAVPAGGLAYQWQRSTSGPGGPWTNIGTTNPLNYIPPAGSTTWYRCIVTCTATGLTATSTVSSPVVVQSYSPTSPCYCTPTNAGTACITNVTMGSLNYTTAGCSGTSNYNMFLPAGTPPSIPGYTVPNFTAGNNVTFSMTTDASAITSVWIDYNQDAVFSSTEWNQIFTSGTSGSITFQIPPTSLPGQTRMRVRSRLTGNQNGAADACLAMGSGETEDYVINISPAGPYDPTVSAVVSPTGNTCPDSNVTLTATICNYGSQSINTTIHPVNVTFKVNGPSGVTTYTTTLPPGLTLGSFGTNCQTAVVTGVNMYAGGNYYVNAEVSVPTLTNAFLANDSLTNAIVQVNFRPNGNDYQLCQYASVPFGQGLSVSGCTTPISDSVTITFALSSSTSIPCLPSSTAYTGACLLGTGTLPVLPPSPTFTSAVLMATNLATANGGWANETRFPLFSGSMPVTPTNILYPSTTGNTALTIPNYTWVNTITGAQMGTIWNQAGGTGSPINIGYHSTWTGNATSNGFTLNAGGNPTLVTLKIYYTYVPASYEWYNVPTGGSVLYTYSPYNPIGAPGSGIANSNTAGTTPFWAACAGSSDCRIPVDLIINPTPPVVQDTMFACEYLLGSNSAVFDLNTIAGSVSAFTPGVQVNYFGDQPLFIPLPVLDTTSTTWIYSQVTYTATGCYSSDSVLLEMTNIPQFTLPVYTGFACAPNAIDIGSLIQVFSLSPIDTLFYDDMNYTIPYSSNPYAISTADTVYLVVRTSNPAACADSSMAIIDVLPATNLIANQSNPPSSFSICGPVPCGNITLSEGITETLFTTNDCRRIATIKDSIDGVNLGSTTICEDINCSIQNHNGQPYVSRVYEITPTNNGKAMVCLYYLEQDFQDYNNAAFPTWPFLIPNSNLCVTKVSGGALGSTGTTAISIPDSMITASYDPNIEVWTVCFPVDSFSTFICHTCNPFNAALPVTLTRFTGTEKNNQSWLQWETSNELNNSHFVVEHSADARNFSEVSKPIPSKAMGGNSSINLTYDFMHEQPKKGHNYYRLKQVDLNGQVTYSGTLDLYFDEEYQVSIYPNPTQQELTVDMNLEKPSDCKIRIMDATGKCVHSIQTQLEAGARKVHLDLSALSSGVYLIQVDNEGVLPFSQLFRKM